MKTTTKTTKTRKRKPLESFEQWRGIMGYPGYEVSSHGRVRSFRSSKSFWGQSHPKILSTFFRSREEPYERVSLRRHGRTYKHFVHRLVAEAFVGQPPSFDFEVAHLDGDATNNRSDNLKWVSHEENCKHKLEHGTYARGEDVGNSKLTEVQVAEIRRRYAEGGVSQNALASELGVSQSLVAQVVRRAVWKHVVGDSSANLIMTTRRRGGRRSVPPVLQSLYSNEEIDAALSSPTTPGICLECESEVIRDVPQNARGLECPRCHAEDVHSVVQIMMDAGAARMTRVT